MKTKEELQSDLDKLEGELIMAVVDKDVPLHVAKDLKERTLMLSHEIEVIQEREIRAKLIMSSLIIILIILVGTTVTQVIQWINQPNGTTVYKYFLK